MAPSATSTNGHSKGTTKVDFKGNFSNTINGKLVPASDGATRHGINPATKKPNPEVPVATKKDLDDAVAAGRAAFKKWQKTTVQERKDAILKYADAVKSHQEEFAQLLTMEQGKPVSSIWSGSVQNWQSITASVCPYGGWDWLHMAFGDRQGTSSPCVSFISGAQAPIAVKPQLTYPVVGHARGGNWG